jgi:hypothetical protein
VTGAARDNRMVERGWRVYKAKECDVRRTKNLHPLLFLKRRCVRTVEAVACRVVRDGDGVVTSSSGDMCLCTYVYGVSVGHRICPETDGPSALPPSPAADSECCDSDNERQGKAEANTLLVTR